MDKTKGVVKLTVKESVLRALTQGCGKAVSGEVLAEWLGVSRAAIWKAVVQLQHQGFPIDAAPGRGYCLTLHQAPLYAEGIRIYLQEQAVQVQVDQVTSSTNRTAKQMGASGAPAGSVAVADCQTEGRGRRGRRFASPAGTGLYLSVVLRSALPMERAALITSAAAVAVCQAIEAVGGPKLAVKWVNDLYNSDGYKCGGILTEAAADMETGGVDYLVVGIGLNLFEPEDGFAPELRGIAGAVFPRGHAVERNRLAAEITNRLCAFARKLPDIGFMEEYRARNLVPGREIYILQNGEKRPAKALAITDEGHLRVQSERGIEELSYGEVSIRFE